LLLSGHNQQVITGENKSFPPFFAEKRYKLRNFAPKKEIVDKLPMPFIFSGKQFTYLVDKPTADVDNGMGKKKDRKFSTYQRPIIPFIPFLKRKEKK